MEKGEYSLVIVDDESVIRRGMCNYIDWNHMGFRVAADFEDGKETIEYIKGHKVDVVLTDIEMAEVSGLEVAQYIFENQLPIKVVILSGYKEFEYAKQAIKYNVEDYILKPIHMDELEKIFMRIYEQLQEQEKKQQSARSREQDFEEILPELQEQFWLSILLGGIREKDNIIQKRKLLSLDFSTGAPCAVVDARLEMDPDMTQKYFQQKNNRYNLLNNIFAGENQKLNYHPVYLSADQLKIVVTAARGTEREAFESCLKNQLSEKLREVKLLLNLDMQVEIERCFLDVTEMTDFYSSRQIHIQKDDGEKYVLNKEDYERLLQKYQLLMDTINDGDFESLDRLMNNIMFELHGLPLGEVKNLLIDMFSMMLQKFMKMSPKLWKEVKEASDYSGILRAEKREDVKNVCSGILRKMMEIVRQSQSEVSKNIVDKMVEYLKQNYGEDISLDMLAERYYMNSSYLSRLFKQYTGRNMTDYLIEIRMEKAKELLMTGKYKVYEVSQRVGYRSDKYFFRVFKQYTGQSPSEYCRNSVGEV